VHFTGPDEKVITARLVYDYSEVSICFYRGCGILMPNNCRCTVMRGLKNVFVS
jgi:hypothetical protein